jgi:uncharacterized OB-fold protein
VDRYIVYPEIDEDSAPYWQSLREHEVKLQKCGRCNRFRFPPSPSCYYCGDSGGDWIAVSGRGTVYSWATIYHPIDKRLAAEVPFVITLVELEEGPRIAGRLFGLDGQEPKVGMPIKFLYDDIEKELTLLNFVPLR